MAVTNVELLKLGLRIRAFRKALGRNQKDFSKLCGLDRSSNKDGSGYEQNRP
jgi:hypothetical protein